MKKQFLLISALVLSFASPVMADGWASRDAALANPVVGETPANLVDHRGTQCAYQKSIDTVNADIKSADAPVVSHAAN